MVGTDGGTVYRCMFLHSSQMEAEFTRALAGGDGGARKPTLRSPVKAEFAPHAGPVHSVDCSPFQRNVFASAGIDGTVRVYNTLQVRNHRLTPLARSLNPAPDLETDTQ